MAFHMPIPKEPPVYEPGHDIRLDFIYGYLTRSFRIKSDKWKAFLQEGDNKAALFEFFEDPTNMWMGINLCPDGVLEPLLGFSPSVQSKCVYVIKKFPMSFTLEESAGVRDALIIGDLPPQPLEALMTFVEEIIRPVVTSEVNQDKWPDTVVTDLKQQTQEICSILYSVQGQLRGKTLLPMPINLEVIEENERRLEQGGPGEVDLQLRMSLESLVIKWTYQVNEVLQKDPSKPLKDGKNPSPYVEMGFWEERVLDLKCIYSQLNDEKVRKLVNILEKCNSTYWPCFKTMFRNVVAALAESQDILAHLKPLRRYLDVVMKVSIEDLAPNVEALMHCVCLIWGHSRYYCSPARIIDLLQEICNMLIARVRAYIDGPALFQFEPLEGYKRTSFVVNTLQLFRDLYDQNKTELPVYFSQEGEAKNWDFLPHLVFKRFDKFLERMRKVLDFFHTSVEFYKLGKVDLGGNRGKYLSAFVTELLKDFTEFYQQFSKIKYDWTDPEDDRFDTDFIPFKDKVDHMDKRLSAIVVGGFEGSDTPEALFKLIITLGALLERPIVKADFQMQYPMYTVMLDQEFGKIKDMFDKIIAPFEVPERSQLFPQYPPYSSSVYWAKGMKERIMEDMEQFKSLELKIDDKEALDLLNDKYNELVELLSAIQEEAFSEWKSTVESQADRWLKENLFGENRDDGSLVVNFNHELYATLKEAYYLQLAGYTGIPSTANKIFSEKETLRKNLTFLDEVAHSYNKMLINANPAERDVLIAKIKKIEDVLKEGKEKITWSASGSAISNYVEKLRAPVADILERFQKSQDNIAALKKLVYRWIDTPLYQRREGKDGDNLLCLDEKVDKNRSKQYREIEEASGQVRELVAKNKELLYETTTPEAAWRGYLNYIDGIVKDGLIKTAAVSVGYLADHTDPSLTPGPLFEMVVELDETGISFSPALDISQTTSFLNLIDDILQDIYYQGTLIKRIKPGNEEDYAAEMEKAQTIAEMQNDVTERVQQVLNHTKEYILRFQTIAHVWEDSKEEYLSQFLKYGRQLTQEEIDAKFAGHEIPEKEPTLDQFREVIDKFEQLYVDVERFAQETTIDKWFRLNMRSFRQSLLNNCKRWSLMFKQQLINTVVGGLQDLDNFIQGAQVGLNQTLKGDTATLISVMKWLQQMKERQVTTDHMFGTIKKYIELLKTYDYEPPDTVFVQLDQLPQKWNKIKKLAVQVKHQVGPLVVKEVAAIRKRIGDFEVRQGEFRDKFKESDFFNKESTEPYVSIDKMHVDIAMLEDEYDELTKQAELFEIFVPEPKALRLCPVEIRFAKGIWDCIFIVESCLEDWKATPWQSIISDTMGLEFTRLLKEAKDIDIDLKQWDIFTTLESLSRNVHH